MPNTVPFFSDQDSSGEEVASELNENEQEENVEDNDEEEENEHKSEEELDSDLQSSGKDTLLETHYYICPLLLLSGCKV